ncbi:hypothetical protein [Blastococcus saxobsidens]|nr:hypothetical protein [Blastococcus saxobsidens]
MLIAVVSLVVIVTIGLLITRIATVARAPGTRPPRRSRWSNGARGGGRG